MEYVVDSGKIVDLLGVAVYLHNYTARHLISYWEPPAYIDVSAG